MDETYVSGKPRKVAKKGDDDNSGLPRERDTKNSGVPAIRAGREWRLKKYAEI